MGIAKVQGSSQSVQSPSHDIDSLKKEAYALERSANAVDRARGHQMLMQLVTAQYDQRLDPPDRTFESTGMPFDAQNGGDVYSNNGVIAAQGVIQNNSMASIPRILAQHGNDPVFLRNFFHTLGPARTAQALRFLANDDPTVRSVDPKAIRQQLQTVAQALSTLVRNHEFSQNDMKQLVNSLAKDSPETNFLFAKDVLGQASPEVNQMFFQAAKDFSLQDPPTTASQAMAADAAQALSQTSPQYQMHEIQTLQQAGKLNDFVRQAMQGEARYGGSRFQSTRQLDGLSRLMGTLTLSSNRAAPNLQTDFFASAMKTLEDKPEVKAYYVKNVDMKNALATTFQQDYDGIVMNYLQDPFYPSQPLTDKLSAGGGIPAFKEFFGDILFSPPVGNEALPTVQFVVHKLQQSIEDLRNSTGMSDAQFESAHGGLDRNQYAYLTGQIAGTFAGSLSDTVTSIKNSADQVAKDRLQVINAAIDSGMGLLQLNSDLGSAGKIISPWAKLWASQSTEGAGDDAVAQTVNNLNAKGIHMSQTGAAAMHDAAGILDSDDPAFDYFNRGFNSTVA